MKRSQLSKILALLLVSIMLIGVIPVNAMAADLQERLDARSRY